MKRPGRPVLFVEDDPDDVALTLAALRGAGITAEFVIARDGEEACRLLEDAALDPAAVLLDLNLPKVSGLEVLAAIRAEKKRRATPVVVLTSSDEPSDRRQAEALGADDYLLKPTSWTDYGALASTLSKYLDPVA